MDIEISPLKPGVSFSDFYSFDHDKNTIFTFENVLFNQTNKPNQIRILNGTYLPIVPTVHYFHFLKEYVGSFLYYKKHINDKAKVLWVDTPTNVVEYHDNREPIQQILKLLTSADIPIVFVDFSALYLSNIKIENLSLIYDSASMIVSSEFPHFDQFRNTNNKEVREFLSCFLVKDNSMPKKVYVSRANVSKVLSQNNDKNNISRYNEPHVEEAIEDFFVSAGYSVIDFSGMALSDQIKYMFNATHVAGLIGANTWNGIFCDDETTFHCLKTHMWFHHPYDVDIKSVISANFSFIELFNLGSYQSVSDELNQKIDMAEA